MAHIILLAIYKVVTARAIVNTKNHYSDRNYVAEREEANCRLHPLIYTLLKFNLPQDMVSCQRLLLYGILVLPSDNQGESEVLRERKNPITLLAPNLSHNLPLPCMGVVGHGCGCDRWRHH